MPSQAQSRPIVSHQLGALPFKLEGIYLFEFSSSPPRRNVFGILDGTAYRNISKPGADAVNIVERPPPR